MTQGIQLSFPLPEFISEAFEARHKIETYQVWEKLCIKNDLPLSLIPRISNKTFATAYGFDLDELMEGIKDE